jgi:NADH-quinone oxidoreductase subunit L
MSPHFHLWLIPLLPLVGAVLNGLLGRRFPNRVVTLVGTLFVGASCAWAWWVFVQFLGLPRDMVPYFHDYATWIRAGSVAVS